jgi:N6-adenosine-specific RNA methylase IME4
MKTLAHYDAARHALAEARRVDEVKDIRDKAVAMVAYARQAKNRDLEADAIEIRMRATRRLDQLMRAQKETVGLAKGGEQYHDSPSTGLSSNPVPTLKQQGIDKNLAHQARRLGALSDKKFEQAVGEARQHIACGEREILTISKDIRARKAAKNRAAWSARVIELSKAASPIPRDRKYPIIYADPPWKFDVYDAESGLARAAAAHYPTMEFEDICNLRVFDNVPVSDVATPDAALFLWTTAPHLQKAYQVLDAWGFDYRTNVVGEKTSQDLGTGCGINTSCYSSACAAICEAQPRVRARHLSLMLHAANTARSLKRPTNSSSACTPICPSVSCLPVTLAPVGWRGGTKRPDPTMASTSPPVPDARKAPRHERRPLSCHLTDAIDLRSPECGLHPEPQT